MFIYKITNKLNGKIYVGQTTRNPIERFKEHKHADSIIGKAIRKYGTENFEIDILDECETFDELNECEMFWIAELNCKVPNGYNVTDGGSYYWGFSDDWAIMYSEAINDLTDSVPDLTTLKLFLKLSSKQEYEGGLKIAKKFIADELKISRTQLWRSFKWMKENGYVKEHKVNGITEFVLNPNVTTCGKNRKEKIKLWESIT